MGATTGIAWCDSTINFWWGCTEVGPGCDLCYARVFSARMNRAKWGDEAPRLRTTAKVWDSLMQWERKAIKTGKPIKVFCQSMSDFFDKLAPDEWREEAWERIKATPHLRYQILTKRISLVEKKLPKDWGPAYDHVGFMCTVVNQQEAIRDIPRLLRLKHSHSVKWVGLSVEPFLGRIFLHSYWLNREQPSLDWVIVGGESARGADLAQCRAYDMEAALEIVQRCQWYNVPVFHKQLGSRPYWRGKAFKVDHWKGEIPTEWPTGFQVQEFPKALLH